MVNGATPDSGRSLRERRLSVATPFFALAGRFSGSGWLPPPSSAQNILQVFCKQYTVYIRPIELYNSIQVKHKHAHTHTHTHKHTAPTLVVGRLSLYLKQINSHFNTYFYLYIYTIHIYIYTSFYTYIYTYIYNYSCRHIFTYTFI